MAELEAQLTEHVAVHDSTHAQLCSAETALAQAEEKVVPFLRQRLDCVQRLLPHSSSLHMSSSQSSLLLLPIHDALVEHHALPEYRHPYVVEQAISEAEMWCPTQVKQLTAAHSSCAEAAEKAQKELRVLRGTCQQLTHDRMQSIANVRKAESEV